MIGIGLLGAENSGGSWSRHVDEDVTYIGEDIYNFASLNCVIPDQVSE